MDFATNYCEPYDDIVVIDDDADKKDNVNLICDNYPIVEHERLNLETDLKQDKSDYLVDECHNFQLQIRQRMVKNKDEDDTSNLNTYTDEMRQKKSNDSGKIYYNSKDRICQKMIKNEDPDNHELHTDENNHDKSIPVTHEFHSSCTSTSTNYDCYHLCFILAIILRLLLVVFSVWQDTVRWPDGQLRFTDVDYDVFSDAAQALVAGRNIYVDRPTYRYSPLIAILLAPGYWLFFDDNYSMANKKESNVSSNLPGILVEPYSQSLKDTTSIPHVAHLWGKLIFIMADIICGCIQYKIIRDKQLLDNVPNPNPNNKNKEIMQNSVSLNANQLALCLVAFGWLFNPVTAVVSVRGNADALQSCFVLACLWCIMKQHIVSAGLLYGLCIHLRIYPIIYAPSIYLWLMVTSHNGDSSKKDKTSLHQSKSTFSILMKLPNRNHFLFGISCSFSLVTLTGLCYLYFGGMLFLQQAYFYHFTRLDFKHNFAPHFLSVYLLSGQKWIAVRQTMPVYDLRQWLNNAWKDLSTLITYWSDTTSSGYSHLVWNLFTAYISSPEFLHRLFNVISIMPCVILIPCLSFKLYSNMSLCWFVLTYVFVTFNRVCTSQYFLWSLCLLPIALADIRLPSNITPYYAVVQNLLLWFGSQGIWLASAYALEMCTLRGAFLNHIIWIVVWVASLNFFACNILVLSRFIRWRSKSSLRIHEVSSPEIISNDDTNITSFSHPPVIDSSFTTTYTTNCQKYHVYDKKTS
ncbi:GPI mannosyltransferase 1 [Schistosoma japonicum]|uniref:GPI alpha-1,4-mannosyltransferase I, catalytic subunit n=1 Tax=Schistosoma japonicum TaxID=6182 RepID=A0A4Z2DNB6_SCHJA|nr:GPI mannosyltransferase 1 [Schistosoma japonicum]TNN18016.1 GPI mannosyltransferase 1 [Schistosoma japonicum]